MIFFPALVSAQDVIAYFQEVGGDVRVTRGDTSAEAQAASGMFLYPGDSIFTGEESYTSVVFQDDGSRVKLGPNAQLTLNAQREKKNLKKKMFLGAGKMWAKVTKKKSTDFQVDTPTSVASVKGTRFVMEEKEGGITWLYVTEDEVELSNGKQMVKVGAGEVGKSTKEEIIVREIEEGELPIEPGKHTILFYLHQEDNTSIQKQLQIDFEL
jgi:hypothetical protein